MVNTSSELLAKSAISNSCSAFPVQFIGRITKIPITPAKEKIFKLQPIKLKGSVQIREFYLFWEEQHGTDQQSHTHFQNP